MPRQTDGHAGSFQNQKSLSTTVGHMVCRRMLRNGWGICWTCICVRSERLLGTVGEAAESQGHVDLPHYRSQSRYDRYGSDRDDYRLVNARAREVAAVLESQGIEPRFHYPGDDGAGFRRLTDMRRDFVSLISSHCRSLDCRVMRHRGWTLSAEGLIVSSRVFCSHRSHADVREGRSVGSAVIGMGPADGVQRLTVLQFRSVRIYPCRYRSLFRVAV